MNVKKMAFYALAVAIGLTLSYVELLIPVNLGVPGAKIGLPNIMTILMLYVFGAAPAFYTAALRIVLSGFMYGNLFSIVYSFAGLIMSLAAMALMKRTGRFGILGVSSVGGVMHNLGQLVVAALLTNVYVFTYFPVLVFCGVIAGILTGTAGGLITGRISVFLRKTLNEM